MKIKAGETVRVDCEACGTEWDITFEPKAKGNKQVARDIGASLVSHCPGCGEPLTSDDEDDAA